MKHLRGDPRARVIKGDRFRPLHDRSQCFTDEEMASICHELGVPTDPEHRERLRAKLVEVGRLYLQCHDLYAETRASEMHREVRELARLLSAAAAQLERMSWRARHAACSAAAQLAKRHGDEWFNPLCPGLPLDEPKEEARDWLASRAGTQFFCDVKGAYRLEAIFAALAQLPSADKGGRVKDRTRDNYIKQLASVYEAATGLNPRVKLTYDPELRSYWGPFLSFVKRNLDIVHPDHGLGDMALGNLIRGALPARAAARATSVGASTAPDHRQP